jgi:antirestriction protein ArdC
METRSKTQTDVYSIINNRIIETLEAGVVPWKQPWTEAGLPQNLITKKPYAGINVLLLASMGFSRNYFLTFKQLMALNGQTRIRKGEKSIPVIFWKRLVKEEFAEEIKTTYLLRYYSVFNVDQCIGIPEEKIPVTSNNPDLNRMEKLEAIIEEMPKRPRIQHKENQAYYNPVQDFINMPKMNNFKSTEAYFGTLYHELIHATGHSSRIGRNEVMESTNFGSEPYSMEELVAEIGACYLKSYTGIDTKDFNNNVAYIQNWLSVLQNDKKFIIYASARAQKAVDYVLNRLDNESEN